VLHSKKRCKRTSSNVKRVNLQEKTKSILKKQQQIITSKMMGPSSEPPLNSVLPGGDPEETGGNGGGFHGTFKVAGNGANG
jgi:hypothetical protein